MRPYTMHQVIVLLLCALTAAAPATDCEDVLIKGADGEHTYAVGSKPPLKDLKCNGGKMILADGTHYKMLQCHHNNRWLGDNNKYLIKDRPSNKEITITCTPPPPACAPSLVRNLLNNKLTFDGTKVECANKATEMLVYKDGGATKKTALMECDPALNGHWKANGIAVTSLKNNEPLLEACVAVPECNLDWITFEGTDVLKTTPNELTCKTPTKLELEIGSQKFDKVICDTVGGWKFNTNTIKSSQEPFSVRCVPKPPMPCDPALITAGTDVDKGTANTLTCKNNKILEIENAEHGEKLTCAPGQGWREPGGSTNMIKGDTDAFSVDCVLKPRTSCVVSAVSHPTDLSASTPKTLTCTTAGSTRKAIEIDNAKYASLTCDGTNWKAGDKVVATAANELTVTCKEYCVTTKCTDPDVASLGCAFEDGLTADAEEKTGVIGEYQCKQKLMDDSKKTSIIMKDKFVYSRFFKCDLENGWTAYGETIEKDPFEKVKIECDKGKCRAESTTCQKYEKEVPAEYFCSGGMPSRLPFHMTEDPNILSCHDKPNRRLYDFKNNKFIDDKLRCNEDNTWYKFGDSSKTAVVDNTNKNTILCLQRRCSMCTTPLPGSDTNLQDSVFKAGTGLECSEATCETGLWKIKITGASAEEEYAGEVICTTDVTAGVGNADPVNIPKWQIDGKTTIEKGSCIAAGTPVKCTEAAKLETACTAAWKSSAGCEELGTLDDDSEFGCPGGKTMFYMKRDSENFEEGGDKIKCEPTKGKWTVIATGKTIDDYERGGTVICADANPAPATTTQLPPTTTPFVEACTACPPFKTNAKPNDVNRENSDNETCIITVKKGAAIKIQKGELIGEDDELRCTKTDLKWKKLDGTEVGEISVVTAAQKNEEEGQMMWIIGGVIGGVVVLFVVFIVIFKVCVFKKKPDDKDEETKRKMLEEGRKKKKRAGDNNDEILDDVAVENPSEIKL